MFVLRGGLFVPSTSWPTNKRVLEMIAPPMVKIDIDVFGPPVDQATTGVSRASEFHFQIFIDVLVLLVRGRGNRCFTGQSRSPRSGASDYGEVA